MDKQQQTSPQYCPPDKEGGLLKGGTAMSVPGEAKAAIGGLACRLPKSRNAQEFWQNLVGGVDMIGPTRWPEGLYGLPPRIGPILDVDKFDNDFFNITDQEANNLNPMLRHLLEVVHECVADSCLPLSTLQQATTGMYLATFGSDYDFIETSNCVNKDHVSLSPYLAGELMRSLRLKGPSIAVDTACSSSLAALDMAVNALTSGRCDYAIVASCNLIINPLFSQQMFRLNMLCKEGQSRVFDKNAAGYVRAEGFGAILLTSDALMLPRVYANIIGLGINCDGYKPKGITYPNSETQAELMRSVYKKAGIDVTKLQYVEAHGTGTQAGDTMETEGIESVFCDSRTEPLLIGSVKSNIGHSEATAGLASIIKCILCLKEGQIPGNLNFHEPNPGIAGLASGKLKVVAENTPLNSQYIGLNSFGFGGVNGHVILEAYKEKTDPAEFVHVARHLLVPLTLRNSEGVSRLAEFVHNNRYNTGLLSAVSRSLLASDSRQPVRGYIHIGPKQEDFTVCSESWEEDIPEVYLCLDGLLGSKVVVDPDLLDNHTFITTIKECAKSIKKVYPDLDLISVLRKGEPLLPLTRVGLLAATALIITMFECLDQAVVPFDGLVACGITEVIGGYLDGCLSLDQCLGIMNVLGKHLDMWLETNTTGDWVLYDVTMDVEGVYRLGPWVQVLAVYDTDHVSIAIQAEHKEDVLTKIHAKGGVFDKLAGNMPLYTDFMAEMARSIKKDVRDILPNPRYWSNSFVSCATGWDPDEKPALPKLCDAKYISRLVQQSINLHTATVKLPEDRLILKLLPTSSPTHHDPQHKLYKPATHMTPNLKTAHLTPNLKMPAHLSAAYPTPNYSMLVEVASPRNQSLGSDSTNPSSGAKGLSYSFSGGDGGLDDGGLDESLSEGSYSCRRSPVLLQCYMSTESLCHTLGRLHMAGHAPCVDMLYPETSSPLGIDTPSLSPLVTWDHSATWDIPHWRAFSNRLKDQESHHTIDLDSDCCESRDLNSPVAVMLFETWEALTHKLATPETQTNDDLVSGLRLFDLVMTDDLDLTLEDVDGAIIQILPGTKKFAVIQEDIVLMSGKFCIEPTMPLPSVPGYDLDMNQNVQTSPSLDRDAECEKTDIKWDSFWAKFVGECVDFASLYLEPPLRQFVIDYDYQEKEAKDGAVFLAVVDKTTGICRCGGLALQYDPVPPPSSSDAMMSLVAGDDYERMTISRLMVYSLSGGPSRTNTDRLMVCQAEKQQEGSDTSMPVLGMINISDGGQILREVPLPPQWQSEDLEVVVPYLLASHILYNVAHIQDSHKLLVLPPIDSVAIYLISLASTLGCSVFTSTYDIESMQTLESMFPFIRVIQGERLLEDLFTMTLGEGVDVCIRLSGGDLQTPLKYVSRNGHVIQGIPPAPGLSTGLRLHGTSKRISLLQPLAAIKSFLEKNVDEAEVLLYDMKSEALAQLNTEGFPEPKGILYNQENVSHFLQPLAVDKLVAMVTEPNLGSLCGNCSSHKDLLEADILAVEKIQALVAPKPKDYSTADTSYVMKATNGASKTAQGGNTLDQGMMLTPETSTDYSIADTSCVMKVINGASKTAQGGNTLDQGMMLTPEASLATPAPARPSRDGKQGLDLVDTGLIMTPTVFRNKKNWGVLSPEINIISFVDSDSNTLAPQKGKTESHLTSTPMTDQLEGGPEKRNKELEESYIEAPPKHDKKQDTKPSEDSTSQKGGLGKHKEISTTKAAQSPKRGGKMERKAHLTPKRIKPVPPPAIVLTDVDKKTQKLKDGALMPSPSTTSSPSFKQRMKAKGQLVPPELELLKPRVDLLQVAPPATPMTPALQEILTPKFESNLVPLNKIKPTAEQKTLYIMHPITGCTSVLEALGKQLQVPCVGIKRTATTPSDSISSVASFYRNAITLQQPEGPYLICGYSYGTIIAFELAQQLQAAGQTVERLIFLDGSPMYVQSQIASGLKHLPTNATRAQVAEALEVGGLINWMKLYGVKRELASTYGLLRKIPTLEERITTAVDLTFGNAIVSSTRGKTAWLTAREKVLKHHGQGHTPTAAGKGEKGQAVEGEKKSQAAAGEKKSPAGGDKKGQAAGEKGHAGGGKKGQFADAAKELMWHMRREKAGMFVTHVAMLNHYQVDGKFDGDINLHRVKAAIYYEDVDLPADYGVSQLCSGQTSVKFYDGDHDSFLHKDKLPPLIEGLHQLLGVQ